MCRHQSAIDATVHEIAQKTLEKHQQGEASKVTNTLANKIRALHGKLRVSLEELYAWMAAADDDPQADVKLSESVVSGMLQGNPAPWHVGSQSNGLRLMLGRRFYMADNDRQRCEEQLAVLPIEKKRLVQWLDIMRQRVQERIDALSDADIVPSSSWQYTCQHGELHWLRWHGHKLVRMREEVDGRLKW